MVHFLTDLVLAPPNKIDVLSANIDIYSILSVPSDIYNTSRSFCGEAALTSIYTMNRLPSFTTNDQYPYECLYGFSPDYSTLRNFGYACFVLL